MNKQLDLLLSKSPVHVHAFLTECMHALNEHNVDTVITDTLQVKFQNILCSGFFHHKPVQFAVALGKPFHEWFRIFVHEFSHFRQFVERPEYFSLASDHIELFFEWVAGNITLSAEALNWYKLEAMEIEYDCESRVLKLIESHGFESILDPVVYAQKGNAYVNFYHFVVLKQKWYKAQQEPYSIESVYQLFPTKMVMLDSLNEDMKKAYEQCIA